MKRGAPLATLHPTIPTPGGNDRLLLVPKMIKPHRDDLEWGLIILDVVITRMMAGEAALIRETRHSP